MAPVNPTAIPWASTRKVLNHTYAFALDRLYGEGCSHRYYDPEYSVELRRRVASQNDPELHARPQTRDCHVGAPQIATAPMIGTDRLKMKRLGFISGAFEPGENFTVRMIGYSAKLRLHIGRQIL